LNRVNPVHTLSYYLISVLIISSHLRPGFQSVLFHLGIVTTTPYALHLVSHACHIFRASRTFLISSPVTVFVLAYKSCITSLCQCLSSPCYFLPLTSTYFNHPVLEHPPCGRPGFASKLYKSNYVFYITFLDCAF